MSIVLRLLVFVLLSFIPCLIAMWRRSKLREQVVGRVLGSIVILITLIYNAYYLNPTTFQASVSLPLQVCDLLGFAAILALAVDWRPARAMTVLCAIPFISQAVLTPVGDQHVTSLRTILYWSFHWCIFATFLFEVVIRKFRLVFQDFITLCLVDLIYVAAVSALDVTFGWNYGYIGNDKPGTPTLVDVLGPWPFRILVMTLLAFVLQLLCYLAFKQRTMRHDFS